MALSEKKFENKTSAFYYVRYCVSISKIAFQIRAIFFLLLIIMTGCTARISRIIDYGDFHNYGDRFVGGELVAGVSVQERPEDLIGLLNRPFRRMNLLVINLKVKNTGPNKVVLNRQDITIITDEGRKYVPLKKEDAISHITGPLGIYRIFLLPNITKGYHVFGLDSQVILDPGEEKSGYLFYSIESKQYEHAMAGEIRILFSQINLIKNNEYKLKLNRKLKD